MFLRVQEEKYPSFHLRRVVSIPHKPNKRLLQSNKPAANLTYSFTKLMTTLQYRKLNDRFIAIKHKIPYFIFISFLDK